MKTMVSTAGTGLTAAAGTPDVLPPGAKAGPWRVEREIGRGGMGTVYAVVHDEIGKRAALKVVHQRLMPTFNSDRMLIEAQVVNQVGHPNIVDIFETGTLGDGRPYIVMERLCGQSLAARADDNKLLPDLVIAILLQICDALIAAHAAGVIHRDLKLDNVFLVDNPDDPATPKVKILDWGIAKVIHHDVRHTVDGQLVGTPQYVSPEQARGLVVSPQTDVYSLGVMAYELFLEQLPFEAETAAEVMAMHLRATPPTPSELWPDVPPALQDLLLAMLAKSPEQRPTMVEVARQLEAVRQELEDRRRIHGAPARPSTLRRTPRPQSRRERVGIAATEVFGWRSETRRWQLTLAALALALTGVLFYISRVGDRAASAAPAPEVAVPAIAGAPHAEDRTAALAPDRVDLTRRTNSNLTPDHGALVRHALATGDEVMPAATEIEPAVQHAGFRPRSERARVTTPRAAAPPRASAPQPAATPPPAAPRRGAKVDPDGTLDVYR
jgi:serine/threonine-protein kinase